MLKNWARCVVLEIKTLFHLNFSNLTEMTNRSGILQVESVRILPEESERQLGHYGEAGCHWTD